MRVADILMVLPEAEQIFAQYGLHCSGCSIGGAEILADAVLMHSMKEDDVNDLLADLHVLLSRRPARPQTLTITSDAAQALQNILITEGKDGWILAVGLDEAGGFSMDILEHVPAEHVQFTQDAVVASASPFTLAAIGGSTIDYRDGRFKLDLPSNGSSSCACKNGGECGCT